MYPSDLRKRLKDGEILFGTGLPAPTPHIAGAVLDARPDFLWIDTEHMPYGSEALDYIPVLARMRGVAPMIRVAWNDPALIKKACDVGAVAVMVPQVDTPEEAARAVQYARHPPEGQRGVSPMWTRVMGVDWNEAILKANEETVLVVQMESRRAWENLEEIARVPGVDVVLVGPLDLSVSLGVPTRTGAREVQEIMRQVPRRLEGTGVVAGTTLGDVEEVREKVRWGYRYLNVGSAIGYGVQVVEQHLRDLRADPRGQ